MHNENSKITSLSGCVLNNYYMYIICETSVSAYSVDCETSSCHLTLHYFIYFFHTELDCHRAQPEVSTKFLQF